MEKEINISLAQINPTLGDLDGNLQKILDAKSQCDAETDLIIYSEQVLTGYPQEDLVMKPFFLKRCLDALNKLAETTKTGPALLISAPWLVEEKPYNAAILLADGEIQALRYKHNLPNYGVFDEKRVFTAGPLPAPISFKGIQLGVMTCEDMWFPEVAESLKKHGADILISLNGSPFEDGKRYIRHDIAKERAIENNLPVIYINQIGGQDELVFDGASFITNASGDITYNLKSHQEDFAATKWIKTDTGLACKTESNTLQSKDRLHEIYATLVLGLRDYVNKNGFKGVLLGMSGGIDSALSAAVAVDALGPDRVQCVMMPSPYTSQESLDDAASCTHLLGAKYDSINIDPSMEAFTHMIEDNTDQKADGLTAENIQARSRGLLLMALSNASGYMVLSTGNKSEMSVGYATLYGDMCGGYNVLKDVYKLDVFALCHWRNDHFPDNVLGPEGRVIPERIITKPPSAELRPDQKDEDSLPPYEILDDILNCLIEEDMGLDRIQERGHKLEDINLVWQLLDRAEYKRRQAPPGVKITSKAFGRDRRYPITNKFTRILNEG